MTFATWGLAPEVKMHSGTTYKQEGKPVEKPVGLFEHWSKDHQYTKIDLKYKKL